MPRPEIPYPNSSFMFACPIDGLPLRAAAQPLLVGDIDREANIIGSHLHVEFNEDATCPNGHRWQLVGDLLLERVN